MLHFGDISYARGQAWVWESFFRMIEPYAARVPYMISFGTLLAVDLPLTLACCRIGNHGASAPPAWLAAHIRPQNTTIYSTAATIRVVHRVADGIQPGVIWATTAMVNVQCRCSIASRRRPTATASSGTLTAARSWSHMWMQVLV